ncbi:MAG: sigma-70 family RNA polymerase sigma factor, partial [archaeon]|nr:sigma-70 family RNA polymerase sigma factor [archaeon]
NTLEREGILQNPALAFREKKNVATMEEAIKIVESKKELIMREMWRLPHREEVYQSILMELCEALFLYDPEKGELDPYLKKVAKFESWKFLNEQQGTLRRKKKVVSMDVPVERRSERSQLIRQFIEDPSAVVQSNRMEWAEPIRYALSRLPPEERILLIRLFGHGELAKDLARELGMSKGNMSKELKRIIQKFQYYLQLRLK